MRCTIEQDKFIGILENFDIVRLSVTKSVVNVQCFNKNGIDYEFRCITEKSEDGIVVFGADMLARRIRNLPGKTVRFKNNVVSDSKGSVFHKLPILSDTERSSVFDRVKENEWAYNIPIKTLDIAIDSVGFCVLSKTDRPVTNNVCFVLFNDSISSFGFDGYKLATYTEEIDISDSYIKEMFFISKSIISLIKKWTKGKKIVRVSKNGNWIYFCNEDSVICFLQQNVDVPDFNKILSIKRQSVVTFDRNEMIRCLTSLISNDDGICIYFKTLGKCTLKCFGEDHSTSAAILDYESDGNPVDFKINGKFLIEVMRRLTEKNVSLSLGGSGQDPVLIFSNNIKCAMAPMVM